MKQRRPHLSSVRFALRDVPIHGNDRRSEQGASSAALAAHVETCSPRQVLWALLSVGLTVMVLVILMRAARRRPDVPLWKMLLLGRGLYPGADDDKEDRTPDHL